LLSPVLELLALLAAEVTSGSTAPPAPRLSAVRTAVPPVIDGKLDDEAWKAAVPVDQFTQQAPFEGRPPSEKTTFRILYDSDSLYVAFDAEHRQTPIVQRLTRRDQDSESDWVWVQLDTRRDGKSAFMFAVNVSGVLADQTLHDQSVFSLTWDENWEARTALTATGWSAEMRIPLRVLRFASNLPVQSWGLQAVRYLAARGEYEQWAPMPRAATDWVARFGRLEDLRDLKQGGRFELRPFATGRVRRQDADTTLAKGYDAGASAGLDLKWHVAQDLTLDAAFNPEFGQVEADQVILNLTNYETFLPEKRPLFLEGIDAFSTVRENAFRVWESDIFPDRLFYSRRIGSAPAPPGLGADEALVDVPVAATIYAAAKLTGQLTPRLKVGALTALTAENHVITQTLSTGVRTSRVVDPATLFNVLRLKHELPVGHLGFMATGASRFEDTTAGGATCPSGPPATPGGRCFHDAYAGGVDGLARFGGGQYTAAGQVVASQIHGGPARTAPDGTQIQSGDRGLGGWARLAKEGGENVVWSLEYTGQGRRIDYNDVGYMARQNFHEAKAGIEYRTLKPGALTLETHTRMEGTSRRNLSGLDLGNAVLFEYSLLLHNFWRYTAAAGGAAARFDDREIGDHGGLALGRTAALERAAYAFGHVTVRSDIRALVTGDISAEAHAHRGGYGFDGHGTVTVHALPQLELALEPHVTFTTGEPRFAGNVDPSYVFGRLLAKSASAILRVSYTFTPSLSLQTYTQLFLASGHYSDLRAVAQTPAAVIRLADFEAAPAAMTTASAVDFEQAALNANVVLRWEYRLGSSLFIVYSRSQIPYVKSFQPPATLRLSSLEHGAAADVVLVKLSYWWGS
jgi:hypothetical protein